MALHRIAYLLMAGSILSACAGRGAHHPYEATSSAPRPAPETVVSRPQPAPPASTQAAKGAAEKGTVEEVVAEDVVAQEGKASYYHDAFEGRRTASGERFSQDKLTAASPDLPLGTKATVINQDTGEAVKVRITDRGPHVGGRVIDLSKKAAERIGIDEEGVAPVRVEARPEDQPTEALKDAVAAQAETR